MATISIFCCFVRSRLNIYRCDLDSKRYINAKCKWSSCVSFKTLDSCMVDNVVGWWSLLSVSLWNENFKKNNNLSWHFVRLPKSCDLNLKKKIQSSSVCPFSQPVPAVGLGSLWCKWGHCSKRRRLALRRGLSVAVELWDSVPSGMWAGQRAASLSLLLLFWEKEATFWGRKNERRRIKMWERRKGKRGEIKKRRENVRLCKGPGRI